jgi:hypothetical protein
MNIIVYANSKYHSINECLMNITSIVSAINVEFIQNLSELTDRVHRLPRKIDLAVLLAEDHGQLYELVSLKDFIQDVPVILILPDQEKETIATATKLYPNFISSVDSDFYLVKEVLGGMLRRIERQAMKAESISNHNIIGDFSRCT